MDLTNGLKKLMGGSVVVDKKTEILITIPPYAPYIKKATEHSSVTGVRVNTVMPIKESLKEMIQRISSVVAPKDLWIDLKCRQLRVTNYATVPFSHLEVSHPFTVDTPVTAYFHDGLEAATVASVDGNKIIMLDGPQRIVGPGESINIMSPSLVINGYFTQKDLDYIAAAKEVGIHKYMLSYVESGKDIDALLNLDPKAEAILKIESVKGLKFVREVYPSYKDRAKLMAARGDLFVEVGKPHYILRALKEIVKVDPDAIAASRLFPSLRTDLVPVCSEITDVGYLSEIGYHRFMVGDDVCFHEQSLMSALNLIQACTSR